MLWHEAEGAIRAHVEAAWAAGSYAAMPLVWEAEGPCTADAFVIVNIEGTFADKRIYGSAGKRLCEEGGIVFFHAFGPVQGGKAAVLGPVVAMTTILELQTVAGAIQLEGGNPPTPAGIGDDLVPGSQPAGNHYRCSGSVPFVVIGAR